MEYKCIIFYQTFTAAKKSYIFNTIYLIQCINADVGELVKVHLKIHLI